jgi:hypothetical protein
MKERYAAMKANRTGNEKEWMRLEQSGRWQGLYSSDTRSSKTSIFRRLHLQKYKDIPNKSISSKKLASKLLYKLTVEIQKFESSLNP